MVLQELIERRERESDVASALLAGLSINGEKVSSVEEMEWKYGSSGLQSRLQRPKADPDDGDGGDSNMLAALAEREVPSSYSQKLAAKGCHLRRNVAKKLKLMNKILIQNFISIRIVNFCILLY